MSLPILATTLAAMCSGCAPAPTGLHVNVHLGALAYDELRFGVVAAGVDGGGEVTLVDPQTLGRKTGPFGAGDQDLVILLGEEISGRAVRCEVTALRAAAAVASGNNLVLGQAHRIRDVDVFMQPGGTPDGGGAPEDAGVPGNDASGDGRGGATGTTDAADARTGDAAGDRGASGGGGGSGGRGGSSGADGGGVDSRGTGGAGGCASGGFGSACTPPCADAQNRFSGGLCSLAGTCVGVGARVACGAPLRSCVAGVCQ